METNIRNRFELPRWFEDFPEEATCPVCNTNNHGATVLVPIDGTSDGSISEAVPVHLVCALPDHFNRDIGILYRRNKP